MDIQEVPETQYKNRGFFQQYGIILSILIGAWIIGMSIVIAGLLIVRQLGGPTVAGVQKIDIPLNSNDTILGSSDAPVIIIEYADFQCPYCKEFRDTALETLKSVYIDSGTAKFVFRDFAFLGQESLDAAEAARCAQDQNKFWEYHDLLYASQGTENAGALSVDVLKGLAGKIALNQENFNKCLDSHQHKTAVENSGKEAQGYGVDSTPTVFINGLMYAGLMDAADYQNAIEDALAEAQEAKASPLSWLKGLFKTQ